MQSVPTSLNYLPGLCAIQNHIKNLVTELLIEQKNEWTDRQICGVVIWIPVHTQELKESLLLFHMHTLILHQYSPPGPPYASASIPWGERLPWHWFPADKLHTTWQYEPLDHNWTPVCVQINPEDNQIKQDCPVDCRALSMPDDTGTGRWKRGTLILQRWWVRIKASWGWLENARWADGSTENMKAEQRKCVTLWKQMQVYSLDFLYMVWDKMCTGPFTNLNFNLFKHLNQH